MKVQRFDLIQNAENTVRSSQWHSASAHVSRGLHYGAYGVFSSSAAQYYDTNCCGACSAQGFPESCKCLEGPLSPRQGFSDEGLYMLRKVIHGKHMLCVESLSQCSKLYGNHIVDGQQVVCC